MIKYKLTTQGLTAYGGFQWEVGKVVRTSGERGLCGPGWLHYYHSPEMAVVMNPIHAAYVNPRLWKVEAAGHHLDDRGLKGGCTEMTLLEELELPKFTQTQLAAFAILCAKQVPTQDSDAKSVWDVWADRWLTGEQRDCEEATRVLEFIDGLKFPLRPGLWCRWWAANAATYVEKPCVDGVPAVIQVSTVARTARAAAQDSFLVDRFVPFDEIFKEALTY